MSAGTPYKIVPFSNAYTQPSVATPVGTVCRTPDAPGAPAHCLRTFNMTITSFATAGFKTAIRGCRLKADTMML